MDTRTLLGAYVGSDTVQAMYYNGEMVWPHLEVSPETVTLDADGDTATVSVDCPTVWLATTG